MVVEVSNPLNQHMHYGDKPVAGIISASDALPNRILYTNTNANRVYNDMQYEIYQTAKHTPPPSKGQFPPILKIAGGLLALGTAIIFRKKIWTFCINSFNKFKNIFKRRPPASPAANL